ncbi:CIC11C00000004906 [Sungouiella intermedia]|uniref:CIC11C00000004906 n=1 Tax=Sungouiella intermedia TaxID=45354 RepID=A0A1L0DGS7_9ASCO|nr:CIC11C00000004906 [[Candida] intermedia]
MVTLLTAERLVKLAYKYPSLHSNWYIIASTALTVVNQPQEIGKILHFALRQQLLEATTEKTLLTDTYILKLAEDSIASAVKFEDFSAVGVNLPDVLIPYTYHDKLPLGYKYSKTEDIHACQTAVASKIREAILKAAPIAGLPKLINALTALRNVTPSSIKPLLKSCRPVTVYPGHVRSSDLVHEDFAGTRFDESIPTYDTLDGPICTQSVDTKQVVENEVRGLEFWNAVYGKVSTRVKSQMFNAYPDLWQYAFHNVYAPLLSYTGVLSSLETSFCVIAALIPQDVNPTLKGHLKGAINLGGTKEELDDIRLLVFDICDWSGNVQWKGGKESVAKL